MWITAHPIQALLQGVGSLTAIVGGIWAAVVETPARPSPGIMIGAAGLATAVTPVIREIFKDQQAKREHTAKTRETELAVALAVEKARTTDLTRMLERYRRDHEQYKCDHEVIAELNSKIDRLIRG